MSVYKSIKVKGKVHQEIAMSSLKEGKNIMEFVEHIYTFWKKHGKGKKGDDV